MQALLEAMRSEQKRQSELIELQAAALQQFRTHGMHTGVHTSMHTSVHEVPPHAQGAEQRYAYAEDEPEELMVVRSELLPIDSPLVPRCGDHTPQGQGSRGEAIRLRQAQGQQHSAGGGAPNIFREEVSAARREGGRRTSGRKSSQAAFGSSVATGRHKMR